MEQEDNGMDLPEAQGQPVEAPEQGLNENALNPVPVEEPPQAVAEAQVIAMGRIRQRLLMAQFRCNQCRKYARGAVITICGHIFCWACLWPQLAETENKQCPRCRIYLFLQDDVIPVYDSPDDGDNVAEPGPVPRPAGILESPEDNQDNQDNQDEQPLAEDAYTQSRLLLKRLFWFECSCVLVIIVMLFGILLINIIELYNP